MTKEKSVLIVENGNAGGSIAEGVRGAAFKADVRSVQNGAEFMDFLLHRGAFEDSARYPSPNLILLDLDVPDAAESAGQVKRHPELRRIPLVLFTASRDEAQVRRGYDIGANSLIQKPERAESFVEALKVLHLYWLESVELPNAR